MQSPALRALSIVAGLFTTGCLDGDDPAVATADDPIIGGAAVNGQTIRDLGLADVGGGCSAVLYTNQWVLTAGHCVSQWDQASTWVNYDGVWQVSDRVYRFGGYNDGAGPDLALIHVSAPFAVGGSTTGYRRSIQMSTQAAMIGQTITLYGRGQNTVSGAGGGGFGIWRTAAVAIDNAVGDMLSYTRNAAGQTGWLGDSGGPSFIDLGAGPRLVGIQSGAGYTCPPGPMACSPGTATEVTGGSQVLLMPVAFALGEIMERAWDATRSVQFFDTTGVEIRAAREVEVSLDTTAWAQLQRVATELCSNRGFVGGHYNGHQLRGRYGLVCSGPGATWYDATPAEINATGWGFTNHDTTHWAHSARAALGVCLAKGHTSGFFTGFQVLNQLYGVTCVSGNVQHFDASWADLDATGWRVDDVNATGYAHALRAANGFCVSRGFVTGFMNGHQLDGHYGVTCQR